MNNFYLLIVRAFLDIDISKLRLYETSFGSLYFSRKENVESRGATQRSFQYFFFRLK